MAVNQTIDYTINVNSGAAIASINNFTRSMQTLGTATTSNFGSATRATNGLASSAKSLIGTFSKLYLLQKTGEIIGKGIRNAMDYIETINLFQVSMQGMNDKAEQFVTTMSSAFSLDPNSLMKAQGLFNVLAKSIGTTTDTAYTMSEGLTMIGTDLASLYNRDIEQVYEQLESAMVGMTRAARSLGIDISEQALQFEASRYGITESVEAMSQAEKMQLRYSAIVRQGAAAQGDFADTIESPANQLRVLQEQLMLTSRAIGNTFLTAVGNILPYLVAFVKILNEALNAFARLVGYREESFEDTVRDAADATYDYKTNLEDGADAAEEAEKTLGNLQGFDEINLLKTPTASADVGDQDFILPLETYENKMEQVQTKADQLFDQLKQKVKDFLGYFDFSGIIKSWDNLTESVKPLVEILKNGFGWVWENILKPFGKWTIEDAIPATLDLIAQAFKTTADILEYLNPLFSWLWENVLQPLGQWTGDIVIEALQFVTERLEALSEALNNNDPLIREMLVLFALLFVYLFPIPSAIGALIIAFGLLVKNWEEVKAGFDSAFEPITLNFKRIADRWAQICEDVKKVFKLQVQFIKDLFSGNWDKLWDDAVAIVRAKWEAITNVIQSSIQGMLDMINTLIKGINDLAGTDYSFLDPFGVISTTGVSASGVTHGGGGVSSSTGGGRALPPYSGRSFADGGFPPVGQMFIANEAGPELVGTIGGQPAVANTNQIEAGIANAVAKTLGPILKGGGGSNGGRQINLYLDDVLVGSALIDSINQASRSTGKLVKGWG